MMNDGWVMKKPSINTQDIKPGNLLRFSSNDFGYGLFSIVENLPRFILVKHEARIPSGLNDGENLIISLCTGKKGSYEWESRILGRIKDGNEELLALSHCSDVAWREDRGCISIHAHLPFVFFAFNPSDESRLFEASSPHIQHATILEMTDREAILKTETKAEGSIFKGHLQLGNMTIDVAGKAVEEDQDRYRLQILSLEERDRKLLLDYIYRNCGK